MTYKIILVHVDNGNRVDARLDLAVRLARRFDAHLIGLYALTAQLFPSRALTEGAGTIHRGRKEDNENQVLRAEQHFQETMSRAGMTSAEWRSSSRDVRDALTVHARYADLVVIGQGEPLEDSGVEASFSDEFVLAAGRPVLLVPYAGDFPTIGERILVAWNTSREATRAVTDAIPMLKLAKAVDVVAFNPDGVAHGAVPGADIGLYLSRHGVAVNVAYHRADDVDVGNQVLSRAADLGSDLIVMGAWGRSRLRELIMGGATRTLLESMTAPVMMSH